MDGEMDGWRWGKAAELGDLLPARLPSACIMCPRSHASIHSLTRVVAEGGEPPQKPQTKHKGEGDRIRVGGADAAARYDDRRRSNEEAEWGTGWQIECMIDRGNNLGKLATAAGNISSIYGRASDKAPSSQRGQRGPTRPGHGDKGSSGKKCLPSFIITRGKNGKGRHLSFLCSLLG